MDAIAGKAATLSLHFQGKDVYLVARRPAAPSPSSDQRPRPTEKVHGRPQTGSTRSTPRPTTADGLLTLHFTPGLQAYSFTFG